jgi:hypothetical protein
MAPAFDLELPDPPSKDDLLNKTERARRLKLGLPLEQPAPEPEVITECPICGCDVSGCALSVGDDGRRRWTQPVVEDWHRSSLRELSGGLVHIEGGRRCLADVKESHR